MPPSLRVYVLGMGTMPWTVNSEIYPLWARSTGNACSAGVNWIFNVLVALTFLHVAEFLTYYGKTSIKKSDEGTVNTNPVSREVGIFKLFKTCIWLKNCKDNIINVELRN